MQTTKERGAHVELRGDVFDSLESWRRAQAKIPPRSEAVRFLLTVAIDSIKSEQAAA
jgi:hypothetical protein